MGRPRLLERYHKEIVPEMLRIFHWKNAMQVPRLEKIVINMGVGQGAHDLKILEQHMHDLALIAGQMPVMTRAKKAISNFKIKKGSPVGCKVTLRRQRMYEFFDRLVNIAFPRIRDFKGLSPDSFDNAGNYCMGLTEQTIFPEIDMDKVTRTQGMDVVFVTTTKNKKESFELLRLLGMPFQTENMSEK
jgi:large subunit ribosomal protein L5